MRKIKICFIQTNVYRFFYDNIDCSYGGSELQLYLIAKELSKKGEKFQVIFIVGDFGQKKIEEKDNIIFYKSFSPKSNDNLFVKFLQAIKYYRLFKKIDADVYFTSTANSLVGIVSFFCKKNNKKHIHRTAHQMDVDKTFIKSNGILGKIYKYGLENSDAIITQCNDHKELLEANHNINAVVIKNSFEIIDKKNTNKEFILWVARYEDWKRPDLFLKLAELFPEEKFLMICNKKADKKKAWGEIRDKALKIENLSFVEKIIINEIQNYFNKAKIFINTSEYEGFPNTFIQAGIAKTPIISLNVNPDGFISKFDCGYYCKNNFNLMLENIEILLNDKMIYNKMSSSIFNYVKTNHNININIKRIKDIILNLSKDR